MNPHTCLKLSTALIEYDKIESQKKSYNRFALEIYLQALEQVKAKVPALPLRDALVYHFSGRLLDKLLKVIK